MSFRRKKARTTDLEWREWLSKHAELLTRSGLPAIVLRNEDHWLDFVENGCLYHHYDPNEFELSQLTLLQKSALLRLLLTWPRLLSTIAAQRITLDMVRAVEGQYGAEEK